jgi:hypothetical protein
MSWLLHLILCDFIRLNKILEKTRRHMSEFFSSFIYAFEIKANKEFER